MHVRARHNHPGRKNQVIWMWLSLGIEGKWAQSVMLTVKPKSISEESRFIGSSCHNFDHKISLFSSSLKKVLCQSFVYFLKECKPNGAKR